MAAAEQHLLSTEIVNRGIESTGPDAGSQTFSVRVRRRLPDFVQSVNLKYVKLGYHYLINHGIYLATVPVILLIFSAEVGSLSREEIWRKILDTTAAKYDLANVLSFLGLLVFTVSVYFMSRPRSIYLIDFACFKPHHDLKVTTPFSNFTSFHFLACHVISCVIHIYTQLFKNFKMLGIYFNKKMLIKLLTTLIFSHIRKFFCIILR